MFELIGSVIKDVLGIVDQVVPDKDKREKAKEDITKLIYNADLQLALKQMEINIEDAKKKTFTWRDLVGYICGISVGFNFLVFPLLNAMFGLNIPPLEIAPLVTLLTGILGLGVARSYDKKHGRL